MQGAIRFSVLSVFAVLLLGVGVFLSGGRSTVPPPVIRGTVQPPGRTLDPKAVLRETRGKLPLAFEANMGQADPEVEFLSRGNGYNLFLTATEAVMSLNQPAKPSANEGTPRGNRAVLRMKLVGANRIPKMTAEDVLPGKINYFIGSDPARWRADVATYAKVRYEDIYPGVELVYYGNGRELECDFTIRAGADPRRIRLAIQGTGKPELDGEGNLLVSAEGEEISLRRPVVYQESGGNRREIAGSYRLLENGHVGFDIAAYDPAKPLVIDPVVVYATYLGGTSRDQATAIAVDAAGNSYITGQTYSVDFPTSSPFQGRFAGGQALVGDAFVAKLNPSGTSLVFSTYLGGAGPDQGRSIAVDPNGNVYVTGTTESANFPTVNPLQAAPVGGSAMFVSKLTATGASLAFSTYIPGGYPNGIAVDASGNIWLTGSTFGNLPVINAIQPAKGGDCDAFVIKINPAGPALVFSTYLGGPLAESGAGIAIDTAGNAYVVVARIGDVAVHKISPTGTLTYSRDLGIPVKDVSIDDPRVSLDKLGNIYVAAKIDRQQTCLFIAGCYVLMKLSSTASALYSVTYEGSLGGLAVDAAGNAYVTGAYGQGSGQGAGAFINKMDSAGSLVYSFRPKCTDPSGIAVDSTGDVHVTGRGGCTTTPGAFQPRPGDRDIDDAFVVKVREEKGAPVLQKGSVVNAASYSGVSPGAIVAIFGSDLASGTQSAQGTPLPASMLDSAVTLNDVPMPLLFVSPTQINAQLPWEVAPGDVSIQVKRGAFSSAAQPVSVAGFSPGIFTLNQQGTGAGAILHGDNFQLVSANAPARRGEFLSVFCTGLGRLQRPVTSGTVPPIPPPETLSQPLVNIANIPALVTYSGLAPGFVGLYQVNVQVPAGAPSGTQPVQIVIQGVTSNTVTIAVQ